MVLPSAQAPVELRSIVASNYISLPSFNLAKQPIPANDCLVTDRITPTPKVLYVCPSISLMSVLSTLFLYTLDNIVHDSTWTMYTGGWLQNHRFEDLLASIILKFWVISFWIILCHVSVFIRYTFADVYPPGIECSWVSLAGHNIWDF